MCLDVPERIAALVTARETAERLKAELADADGVVAKLEAELMDAMTAAGTPQLEQGGTWFTCTERRSWKVPEEARDEVTALLEAHQADAVKKTIHPATLSKLANDDDPSPWRVTLRSRLESTVSRALSVAKKKPRP